MTGLGDYLAKIAQIFVDIFGYFKNITFKKMFFLKMGFSLFQQLEPMS